MAKRQLELNLDLGRHGGRRRGSGRKLIHSAGVAHRKRERVTSRNPLHINFKYKVQIKNKTCLKNLKRAIVNARRLGLKVIHYSLQSNHIHLIVEAQNNEILTKGMRSLTVALSKGIAKGRVQMERYHLHVLKGLREARNAINYVLFNEQKHSKSKFSRVDGFSSLLSLSNAYKLIRRFAVKEKVTLFIDKAEDFSELSMGRSFLLMKALEFDDNLFA